MDVDPNYLCKIAAMESNFNPKAKAPKGTASGLFQINKSTEDTIRSRYDITGNIFNPRTNALIAGYLTKENSRYLKGKKIKSTGINNYYAHFFGAYNATKFIKANGNTLIRKFFPHAYKYNKGLFRNRTISQIKNILTRRYNKAKGCK